jgi:hypothetical protein
LSRKKEQLSRFANSGSRVYRADASAHIAGKPHPFWDCGESNGILLATRRNDVAKLLAE